MESQRITIPSTELFKVCQLNSAGVIKKVYVFSGGFLDEATVNINEIFSEIELAEFRVNNTEIVYSNQQIHKDDSVRILKKKVVHEIGIDKVSYNELYLFSTVVEKVRFYSAFLEMTNNEAIPMGHNMLGQLLLNINIDDEVIDKIEKKDVYSFDDVLKIVNPDIEYEINVSIGQRFTNIRNLLFTANPFQIIPVDNLYQENSNNPRINFENQLLLNNGALKRNTIYLCFASDIFEYATQLKIDQDYISNIYFPLLSKIGIKNKRDLDENRAEIIKDNKKIIKPDTMKLYETVDLFYNMYYSKLVDIPYISKGITYFHLVLHPDTKTVLPLDAIFKNIHATIDIPFIKYNAGSRKENIYRLYSEKVSRTGKKIPFLPKNLIMNLSNITGKSRQISLFLQKVIASIKYNIFINFEYNGNISVRCELKEPLSKEDLEKIVFDSINPVIRRINSYLEQTGYQLNIFQGLTDDLLEIVSMKYVSTITMEKKIDITQQYGCLSSIFNIVEENLSKGAILEYKRVENYQKMDSIASTITEAYNNTYNEGAIINIIIKKYNMPLEEASMQLAKYLNEHTRIQGKYANKSVDIAENPGFITLFNVFPFENKFVIEIDRINNIAYLDVIMVYIDSFLRMSQLPDSSSISSAKIKQICKKGVRVEDTPHISTVIAPAVIIPVLPVAFAKVTKFPGFEEEGDDVDAEEDLDIIEDDEGTGFEFGDEDEDDEGFEFGEEDESVKEVGPVKEVVPVKEVTAAALVAPLILEKLAESSIQEGELPESISPKQEVEVTPQAETLLPAEPIPAEPISLESIPTEPIPAEPKPIPVEPIPVEPISAEPIPAEPFISEAEGEGEDEEEGFEFEDYDEEEQEEEEEEEEEESPLTSDPLLKRGGTNYDEKRELFDNKPFKKQKIFIDKMFKREPKLFLEKDQGGYASYARVCPTNVNLQPVMLTTTEKERIDKEFPGSYGKALKYGTDPNNPNYYICPRYWCLLSNSSMTHEDVIAGKCGKIIPKEDSQGKPLTKIPPGHYVYEFTDDKYHKDDQGKYREHFPGFKPGRAHPDGLCIPCCYNNWNSESRKKRREQCTNPLKHEDTIKDDAEAAQNNLYVVGAARFPMPQYRWGFLPPSIEAFFQIDHMKVVTKNNPALIVENKPVLLRYGVEQSVKQSFLGCLADAYGNKKNIAVPTITEMRTILITSITLDMFLRYHNGSLVSIFQPKKIEVGEEILSKYNETAFYKSIDQTNESQMDFLEDTIASFENFLAFLNDDNAVIDHTYLWDIIITPNDKLFTGGVNLVVIEIADNDITDNIRILCPTNSYSKKFYDTTKETLILLKHDNFYDPIYLYQYVGGDEIKAIKLFYKDVSIKNVKRVLDIIQTSSNKYCAPLSSMPKVYKFERSLPLVKLRELLKEQDYVISSQVMNYQGKIIGVIIKDTEEGEKKGIFVPCFPSPAVDNADLPLEFMENDIWQDYRTTRDTLLKIYRGSSKKIPCDPVIKVVENNLIVGILTLTNQFIQVTPPSENIEEDGIEVLKSSNYIIADKVLTTSSKEDEKRIEVTKNIYLESQFYLAFRSTIRILLNVYSNKEKRDYLLRLIESTRYLYKEKLKKIEEFLRILGKNKVTFQEFDKKVLYELHEISTCTSDCEEKKYCIMKTGGDCNLMIPKQHLVSGVDNEVVYFARMADELLRYKRIRIFMFETKTYLNITNLNYKLNPNEFIILESLLTSDYFNDLIPFQMNSYVSNITYELSKPDVTQKYLDIVPLAEQIEEEVSQDTDEFAVQCIRKVADVYGNSSNIWKKRLPKMKAGKEIKEIYFNESNNCSFYVIIQILKMKLGGELNMKTGFSIANIKDTLLNAYAPYLKTHNIKIFDILKKQGKKDIITKVERGLATFDTVLMSEEYYFTDLDIWVIANKLNLPIVLFSLDIFKTMMTSINWLVLAGDIDANEFYFIRSPKALKTNTAPNYSLIDTPLKLFEVKGMDGIIQNMATGSKDYAQHFISFETFIREYKI